MMSHEMIKGIYAARLQPQAPAAAQHFPAAPRQELSPAAFVSHLVLNAAELDPRSAHPFLRRLVSGGYSAAQMQQWARQHYQTVVNDIRRHAILAGCAADCDLFRSLLSYSCIEADADPVGGAYFSLPQLWIKFGISLGLNREQIVGSTQAGELQNLQQAALAEARSCRTIPVSLLVDAILNPALAAVLGESLKAQLGYPRDAFDYFWAIAGNRWGDDAGRAILESWSTDTEAQRRIWARYSDERAASREWDYLSLLQQAVEFSGGRL
jgi:hypothetical protein